MHDEAMSLASFKEAQVNMRQDLMERLHRLHQRVQVIVSNSCSIDLKQFLTKHRFITEKKTDEFGKHN